MNSLLSQISSYSASIILKSARSISGTSSLHGFSSNLSWKRSINHPGIKTLDLGSFVSSRFAVFRCYCAKRRSSRKRKSTSTPKMEDDKDAFFVVRKGDIVGVYKTLSECQAQVSPSICDPPVSVFKGHSLPKVAEEYLISRGLQNALYMIKASDLKDDIFGTLVPCPFQEPSSKDEMASMDSSQKRPHDMLRLGNVDTVGSVSASDNPLNKLPKLDNTSSDSRSCIIEFDGASKGNPGQAGAGVVLRAVDGNIICKIRQGLGISSNNVAEYRAAILGLKKALEMGYKDILVQGDSKLVCMQIQGLWKVRHPTMFGLHSEAKKLKEKFSSFQIKHVLRDLNSDADAEATLATCLPDGQILQDFC